MIKATSKASLLTCAIFLSWGCVAQGGMGALSPSELQSRAKEYRNRQVTVRGYLNLAPESHILYESRDKYREFRDAWRDPASGIDVNEYEKFCLTVANPDFVQSRYPKLSGESVIVSGKFIDDYLDDQSIDLGACPLNSALIVESVAKD